MEMQLDTKVIRAEREKRAWTQEHLAAVAGLGVRTVQRIESTGRASFESASALAAVFEMRVAELRAAEPVASAAQRRTGRSRRAAGLGFALVTLAAALLIARSVIAEQVMLEVGVSVDEVDRGISRLITEEGRRAEVLIDEIARIVLVPTLRDDGLILITTEVYVYDGSGYVLATQPKVATRSERVAEIQFGTDAGQRFRFLITPHRQ